jgi:hypothetical protein
VAAVKKSKKTKVAASCCPEPIGGCAPRLYIDLQDQDVKQIGGLNVGDEVELRIRGTVKGLSQRERADYDDASKTVKTGSIDLENYTVEVMEDEKNDYTKMADEEETEA